MSKHKFYPDSLVFVYNTELLLPRLLDIQTETGVKNAARDVYFL